MANEAGQCTDLGHLYCDSCKNDGQNVDVEGFCVDCEEYLCKDCYKVHCRPSVIRHHVLQEKQDMPRSLALKPDTCKIHADRSIEHYCKDHDEVFCPVCRITNHKNCRDVKCINKMLSEINIKNEFAKLKGNTKLLKNDINRTQYLVQTSHTAISISYNNARDAMDKLRSSVIEHIYDIERKVDKTLKTINDEDFRKITTHQNTCEAMHFDVNTLESYVQAKISTNRKYDAFVAIKRALNRIRINHVNLEKIRMDNEVRRYEFTPDDEVIKLTAQLNCFGEITLNKLERKSTQFIIALNARHAKDTHMCDLTGLCLISESLVAAADQENKDIKIINTNMNKITANVSLTSPPCDLTMVPDSKLVVTLPEEKRIQFLSVALPKADAVDIERFVTVSGKCHGIDFIQSEGKLIVTYCDPGKVEIISLDGIIDRKVDLNFSIPTKISVIPNTSLAYFSEICSRSKYSINNLLKEVDFGVQKIKVCQPGPHSIYPQFQGITSGKLGVSSYMCTDNKVFVTSNDVLYKDKNCKFRSPYLETVQCGGIEDARSIAFCDKIFRLYIGTRSDNIKVYIVA